METKVNEQVKRNIERFPEKFRFQLTEVKEENIENFCNQMLQYSQE